MRKLVLLSLVAMLPLACSNKSTSSNNNNQITVTISPRHAQIGLDSSLQFSAVVSGTSNQQVTWEIDGDSTLGVINTAGQYHAPHVDPQVDSVKVVAHSVFDLSGVGNAWVLLHDSGTYYVRTTGNDSLGDGSYSRPFRTISHALNLAITDPAVQTVAIAAGTFDAAHGEDFPLTVRNGITLHGAGADVTVIESPGGAYPPTDAVIALNGTVDVSIENVHIASATPDGIGIWVRNGGMGVRISHNRITDCGKGIQADSTLAFYVQDNFFTGDSVGISMNGPSRPIIRGCDISDCPKYGIEILGNSLPDLGTDSLTNAGNNTIQNCGDISYHWLIYNLSPNSIWAVGNTWQLPNPNDNDQYIYDNEENSSSGDVKLTQ